MPMLFVPLLLGIHTIIQAFGSNTSSYRDATAALAGSYATDPAAEN